MRTTVDLPPAAHRRAREIAVRSGRSLSSVVADLALRGLAAAEDEQQLIAHHTTGFPTVSVGHSVDAEDVATLWDDE
ncbi:hypothetical protein [Haloactinopolyspora alba]|uniref:hypothetical protein n=1 Tax=Haloactinopolyspora alba TaxID=648780 RepID=UPI000D0D2CAF|nr:hypothetical protein [Haloactinopolyspora alba]